MDRFLDNLTNQGKLDSEGRFTIGWEQAQRKLHHFQAGDPEAFLLLFISAGRAMGARNVSIEDNGDTLSVTMHECYISQEDLRTGFMAISEGQGPPHLLDLAMGVHGGLRGRVTRVHLQVSHPQKPSFLWTLTKDRESCKPLSGNELPTLVSATFTSALVDRVQTRGFWNKFLNGYVGMNEPCRIVDKRCDFSDIPISINRQMANRPLHLPPCEIGCLVGTPKMVRMQCRRVLRTHYSDWKGALVLHPGNVVFVVNSISYPPVSHPKLSGAVWADLPRDLSRKRLLEKDPRYWTLWRELREVAAKLNREADSSDC